MLRNHVTWQYDMGAAASLTALLGWCFKERESDRATSASPGLGTSSSSTIPVGLLIGTGATISVADTLTAHIVTLTTGTGAIPRWPSSTETPP